MMVVWTEPETQEIRVCAWNTIPKERTGLIAQIAACRRESSDHVSRARESLDNGPITPLRGVAGERK